MSTLKTNNVQVGQSVTATNNFTLYQPSTPDGTVRIGVGNSGATTSDVVVIGSSGITKGVISPGTAVTASGTSVDFTGIPSTAKRITVMLNGVSLSGTANIWIQIGSGTVTTSGYVGNRAYILNTGVQGNGPFTGALIEIPRNNAASATTGHITITNVSGNLWIASMVSAEASVLASFASGTISLGGILDRVRITTSNGTDTFDAGTINILWEG